MTRFDQHVRDQSVVDWTNDFDGRSGNVRPEPTPKSLHHGDKPRSNEDSHGQLSGPSYPTDNPENNGCTVESEPLIPPGNYNAVYISHSTTSAPGTGKLIIRFTIVDGEYEGTILKAFYRVELKGPIGKFGKFAASKQGDYFEQMCELFPDLTHGRSDRISPQRLKEKNVLAKVSTVKRKWNGDERKPHTQYSKIERLLSLC